MVILVMNYYSDGKSSDTILFADYSLFNFTVKDGKFRSEVVMSGYTSGMTAKYLNVYGLSEATTNVTINSVGNVVWTA